MALGLGVVLLGLAGGGSTIAQAPPVAATEAAGLTSERISLDLKGVDILDVLKLLSQKSGLNFVAGRNVAGKVTIFAKDVDIWEAFELIIGANDLAYERHGDIVTVMTARDFELLYGEKFQERKQSLVLPLKYANVVQVATVLNQLKSSVGQVVADEASNTLVVSDVPSRLAKMQEILVSLDRPTETRVYTLNYAEAEQLKEKVQDLMTPVGTFAFDTRSNKVVLTDLPEVLLRVDRMVRAFDVPEGEVLIEAKIIKVELTDEFDLGIDWQQVFSGIDTKTRTNFRVLGDIVDGTAVGGALKLLTSPKSDTTLVVEALKKIGKTETLSNPRIMVSNNQEAKILVGTKEAFVTVTTTVPATGSVVSSPEIEFVDVGTKLYVTPKVKQDGYVQLKVRPEVSTATVTTFGGNRIPIVTTTEAETTVLVKSGVTLIIGGLIDSKKEHIESRLPILGDIPILGLPFRGTVKTERKTELVVFLTPEIIMADGSAFVPPEGSDPVPDTSLPEVILQDPVPPAYRNLVRQRLQERLGEEFRRRNLGTGSVVLNFVVQQDGRVAADARITSPDGEPFVEAARAALETAQPFDRFPEGARATEVRFRLAVEYAP